MARNLAALPRALTSAAARKNWRRYLRHARRPWPTLLFLLPWLILYEVAAWRLSKAEGGHELLAQSMIKGVLAWFDLRGVLLPGLLLVAGLVIWHVRRRESWQFPPWVLPAMLLEGLVLSLPLWLVSGLFPAAAGPGGDSGAARAVAGIGAGIYEEAVFRLLLITLLLRFVARGLQLDARWAQPVAIGLAALAFALCHFQPVGADPFAWRIFWFKLAAGAYLGIVFMRRGVGVSTGTHMAYNLLRVWL